MDVFLWILQVVLAMAFLWAGGVKLMKSRAELQEQMAYVEDFSAATVNGIGALEVLVAVALVAGGLVGVAAVLTPVAALGLVGRMIGAGFVHRRRGEPQLIAVNAGLGLLAAVVVW